MRLAVVLLLVAACGRFGFDPRSDGDGGPGDGTIDTPPPPPFAPTWISGTRIRARVLQPVDGGDPVFMGWHDTLLDTYCLSSPAADGVERCVPDEVRITNNFSDAACTQPIVKALDPACGGTDRFAYEPDGLDQVHVFPLTGPYVGTVYSNVGAQCVVEPVASYDRYYTFGAELPAAMFIATEYENRIENGYLRVHAGFTDGSEQLLSALADPAGRTCAPTMGRLGETVCREVNLPTLTQVYLDAACTQPAFRATGTVLRPRFHVDDPQVCGVGGTRYDRGANVTQPTHWTKTVTGCQPQATGTSQLYLGTVDPTDPYPRGSLAVGPRRGRLGKLYWTTTDGTAVEMFAFDHVQGLPCRPFRGTDQRLRCLPSEQRSVTAIPDGMCTGTSTQLVGGCYGVPPLAGPSYTTCRDRGWTVRTYEAAGPEVSAPIDGMCHVLEPPPDGLFDATAMGSEVPPDMFPELVEIVE